jgi:zinc transporter ZupT
VDPLEYLRHVGQGKFAALRVDPGVLHSASFAKYPVAFLKMSTCIFSRAFSARSLDSSICSAVIGLAPGGRELASRSRLDPVAQRLLDQPEFAGANPYADLLGTLDGLFLELSRVLLLRHLLHFSSFKSRC